jgi:hypothetical protein
MRRIKIFLASSNELMFEREHFEIEINRKNKLWLEVNVFLHLEIWEDLSSRMSLTRLQDEYNMKVQQADLFVLLAYSKVGMYTEEEFETAFGSFQLTKKPFIFIYFKDSDNQDVESVINFKNKLTELGHFYSTFSNFDNLWSQFNKELDRIYLVDFERNQQQKTTSIIIDNQGANIKNQFNNVSFNNTEFN